MLRKVVEWWDNKERDWRQAPCDISTPEGRKNAQWRFDWLDHAVLRRRWHNFDLVAEGVYRSNHPDHARWVAYADMGIKTVLNLRGALLEPPYLFEVESCDALGLELVTVPMGARHAPSRETLEELIAVMGQLEKPFVMHCKSGADRTGLAAALYLMVYEGATVAEAAGQLSFRYLHIRRSKTGILDHFLDTYAARQAQGAIGLRDWIATEYDPVALTQSFAKLRASWWFWQGWR